MSSIRLWWPFPFELRRPICNYWEKVLCKRFPFVSSSVNFVRDETLSSNVLALPGRLNVPPREEPPFMSAQEPSSTLFSQVDVTSSARPQSAPSGCGDEHSELLREVLSAQDRTNELLEDLVGTMASVQRQRTNELNQWRDANPYLANACRDAAESLSQVQIEFLDRMTEEINETHENLMEGDFMLNDFIDRFGGRLAHLNGVIQVLAQLSSAPNPASNEN